MSKIGKNPRFLAKKSVRTVLKLDNLSFFDFSRNHQLSCAKIKILAEKTQFPLQKLYLDIWQVRSIENPLWMLQNFQKFQHFFKILNRAHLATLAGNLCPNFGKITEIRLETHISLAKTLIFAPRATFLAKILWKQQFLV